MRFVSVRGFWPVCLLVACATAIGTARAEDPGQQKALAAGEFGFAKTIAAPEQDRWLGQIATAQSLSGESLGAVATVRGIDSPADRNAAINRSRDVAGQGGGAFADFDSLMNLIETTVVPDTWEALGGNSTMAPYPQGIFVDPKGTVITSEGAIGSDARENLGALLATGGLMRRGDWRDPSPLRVVSLRRVRDAIAQRRMSGLPLGDELLHLSGLSEVKYLVLTEDDVLLAAPVGGIDDVGGWFVDRQTGRAALRSDFLSRCLSAAQSGTPFGCTIDPTPEGMQRAAEVAAQIRRKQIPLGTSADKLREALGMQRVEVFGASDDTSVALLMVEADRHMKQLALGQEEMPEGVSTYLDAVDEFIELGPPDGLLLRLWFTADAQSVRCDNEKTIFELSGNAVRLSGQNQRALGDGNRGDVTVDPRSQRFVELFNQNWTRIRDAYPIYGSLESLYRLAAVSQLIHEHGNQEAHQKLAASLAFDEESRDWMIRAPKQVESIATLHNVRRGSKRHHVLLASGGVAVDTKMTLKRRVDVYPTLASKASVNEQRPTTINRWWWDIGN